ncbi:hypothetical protein CK203_003428 [Vitis vinifera]|uniref:Reverse transcriptase domain-containing protein n=1 Tax=Vitis vinifera TaxID=29760 RepID=A0A438K7I6_VITVI|nr:hypothetical protein CK203_003428 [Vitis vinifera]
MSKLDLFLVLEDWECHFSGVVQCTFPRPMYDHCPILLDGGGVRSGPIPFRFQNMWLKEEEFKELLKSWWQGFNFNGSCSFVMAAKLKALKTNLRIWNNDVFGKIGVNKSLALHKASFWDEQEKLRVLTMEEVEIRKEAKDKFEKWTLMEEINWRQKSRELWLRERDKKIGFFRRMANSHRRKNCWTKIKINRTWKSEEHEIQGGEDVVRLEKAFSVEKVFSILPKLNRNKALGLNDFYAAFWVKEKCRDGARITHLLFIDDTLRINLDKNEILLMRRVDNSKILALELDCKVGTLPFSYLGLPLGALHKSVAVWDGWRRGFSGYVEIKANPKGLSIGEGGALERKPHLVKPFNDGEVEMVEMVERWFLVTLQGKRVITDLEDRVLWKEETKDGKFSVKSLYGALELRTAVSFLRSTIWNPCVPTKVGFFA